MTGKCRDQTFVSMLAALLAGGLGKASAGVLFSASPSCLACVAQPPAASSGFLCDKAAPFLTWPGPLRRKQIVFTAVWYTERFLLSHHFLHPESYFSVSKEIDPC